MNKIISAEQIRGIENLNYEAIKFYIDLAEKRLNDELETKKQFEQKTFVLMSGYITAAIALFGLAEKFQASSFWFNITALIFCAGILPLFISLKSSDYGKLGKNPADLLQTTDYIAVNEDKLPHIYAYILREFVNKIDASTKSNLKKSGWLNVAIILGLLSVVPFLLKVLFCQHHPPQVAVVDHLGQLLALIFPIVS